MVWESGKRIRGWLPVFLPCKVAFPPKDTRREYRVRARVGCFMLGSHLAPAR